MSPFWSYILAAWTLSAIVLGVQLWRALAQRRKADRAEQKQ